MNTPKPRRHSICTSARCTVQAGDPDKLAMLIMQAVDAAEPPLHLFAGKIANELAAQKTEAVQRDLDAWKGSSEATDFAE
jgi:hypothetical protein